MKITENGQSFSPNLEALEVTGDPMLAKSIIRHQGQLVELSTTDFSQLYKPQGT